MLTTEELRVAALQASVNRGKWVAKRRVIWRWFAWASWTYVLPTIGLLTILVAMAGFAFWQYLGTEQAYKTTQTWLQNQLGVPESTSSAVSIANNRAPSEYDSINPAETTLMLKTTLQLSTQLASPKH